MCVVDQSSHTRAQSFQVRRSKDFLLRIWRRQRGWALSERNAAVGRRSSGLRCPLSAHNPAPRKQANERGFTISTRQFSSVHYTTTNNSKVIRGSTTACCDVHDRDIFVHGRRIGVTFWRQDSLAHANATCWRKLPHLHLQVESTALF